MTLRERVAQLEAERDELRRQVAANDHPVRCLIVGWLAGRPNGSPVQFVAEHQDVPLGVAAYHFRVLAAKRRIRLARTRPVRGAREHFYALKSR